MPPQRTKEEFKASARAWAAKLGVTVKSISFRPMSKKWASWSTSGNLTLDEELLGVTSDVADYVIVHELLHHHAPNHGKLWKSLMRAHLGDYEDLETQLRTFPSRADSHKSERERG